MLMAVCQRCASFSLFSFLFFHESVAVSKSVDIGNSKMCNHCFVFHLVFIFVTENLLPLFLSTNCSTS